MFSRKLLLSFSIFLMPFSAFSAEKRQVTCATKDGHGRITHIGGDWGTISSDEAIRNIESGKFHYYSICKGKPVKIVVISGKIKYLRTVPNNKLCDNLDVLPNCP